MRFLKVASLIVSFLFINISFVASKDLKNVDFQYTFVELNDGYAFRGKFFVVANDSCLSNIIYEPEHLKRVLKNICTIDVISKGKDSFTLSYIYKIPFIEIKSTYRKTLCLLERKVVFEMISYEQKGITLPRILSSSGNYEIIRENNGFWVEYYQGCQLEKSNIKGIYLFFAKNKAVNFLRNLKKYAERTCH